MPEEIYIKPVIGTVTTRKIQVKVCQECNCVIGDTGLCNYGCKHDGEIHPPGTVIVRTYERVDTLVAEELR